MDLPDDAELFRIFLAQTERDPQIVRDLVDDPARGVLLDSTHEELHSIVHGVGDGEENIWYLIPSAQDWVRSHADQIRPPHI